MNTFELTEGMQTDLNRSPAASSEKEYQVIAAITRKRDSERFLEAIDARLQKDSANLQLLLEKAQLYRNAR